MNRTLAIAATVIACAALAISLTRTTPNQGVTSCARIAYDYVAQVAKQQGLRIDRYQLQACHKLDANHAVARVHVTVDLYGLQQSATLVYHLTRSPWQADVSAVAG